MISESDFQVTEWRREAEWNGWRCEVYWGENRYHDCKFYKIVTVTDELYRRHPKTLEDLISDARNDLMATLRNVRDGLNKAFESADREMTEDPYAPIKLKSLNIEDVKRMEFARPYETISINRATGEIVLALTPRGGSRHDVIFPEKDTRPSGTSPEAK